MNTQTSIGGYTCYRCKAYVPNGCAHYCPMTAVGPYGPAPQPQPEFVKLDHGFLHTAALQRIADALEKIAERLAG